MKIRNNFWMAAIIPLLIGVLICDFVDPFIITTFWSAPCSGGADPIGRCAIMDGWVIWVLFVIYGIIASGIAGFLYRKQAKLMAFGIGLVMTIFLIALNAINSGSLSSQFTDAIMRPDIWGWVVGAILIAVCFHLLDKEKKSKRKTS